MNEPTEDERAFIEKYLLDRKNETDRLRRSYDELIEAAKQALLAGAGDWSAWARLSEAIVKAEKRP